MRSASAVSVLPISILPLAKVHVHAIGVRQVSELLEGLASVLGLEGCVAVASAHPKHRRDGDVEYCDYSIYRASSDTYSALRPGIYPPFYKKISNLSQ